MPVTEKKDGKIKIFLNLNLLVCCILILTLIFYWLKIFPFKNDSILIVISIIATLTVFFSALRALKNKFISIDLLASIALIVSLIEKEWVSAIFINLMIASARTFTNYVKIKSHSAVESLMKLKPKKVKIDVNGKIIEVPVEKVKKGDRVIIELGERVPVDGLIEEGEAEVDQSSLTGESLPVLKKKGDLVLSSTTVVSGDLVMRAEKVGEETTFEKIVALVEKSQLNKAPINTLINKFSNWYIIFTVLGSFIVYLFSKNTSMVLALLLVSCADDIAVATPLALMTSIIRSAKQGAIIKGAAFLEGLTKLKIMIFDKTGTLTQGKLKVENIFSSNHESKEEIIKLAAMVSSVSSHPIAHAIINYAKEKNISLAEPENCEEYSGKGMSAFYKHKKIIIGKLSFFEELNIKINQKQLSEINEGMSKGYNVTLVGYGGKLIGFIALTDAIKPKVKETMKKFKNLGIEKTVMLTGDNQKTAQKISEEIGMDEFHANLLPQDKLKYLKKYLNKKYKVAMVGDGVNDAPVLALADIGIAMGAIGSDVAIDAADIAMMKDDLSKIPEVIEIGHSTLNVIKQNILLWGLLNIFGFILVFLHVLNPSGAAAYNFISDFIPILNSLRLFRK